uniref:Alcohol dehydrogenase-like C-terminal domain-containing protein n=1 Tax=Brassica oleracea var. oleracea TaxID=109376 RepID=A0A0D3E230_BRAOL
MTLGATHIVNAAKDAVERIRETTGGMGVDVAVEALGKPQTFMQCTLSVRDGGKAVMIGPSQAGSVGEIDINRLFRRKNLCEDKSDRVIWRQDLPKVVKPAESGIFNLANAVSSRYKFEDAGKSISRSQ